MRAKIHMLLLAALLAAPAMAQEEERELGMSVIGNRELPKTLIIVPWKAPQPGEFIGEPLQSLVDESLAPIDPDVHRRQVRYYQALNTSETE